MRSWLQIGIRATYRKRRSRLNGGWEKEIYIVENKKEGSGHFVHSCKRDFFIIFKKEKSTCLMTYQRGHGCILGKSPMWATCMHFLYPCALKKRKEDIPYKKKVGCHIREENGGTKRGFLKRRIFFWENTQERIFGAKGRDILFERERKQRNPHGKGSHLNASKADFFFFDNTSEFFWNSFDYFLFVIHRSMLILFESIW